MPSPMKKMTCFRAGGRRPQAGWRTRTAASATTAQRKRPARPVRIVFTAIRIYYNPGPKPGSPFHEAGHLQDLEMVEDGLEARPPLVLGVEHLLDVEGAVPSVDEQIELGRVGQGEA